MKHSSGRTPACRGCWTMTWSSAWYYDRATRWWWRPWYPQQEWRLRTRRRRRRRRLGRADGGTGASGGGGRARLCSHRSTSKSPTTSVDRAIFFSECADKFGEIGDVYMDGKKTSGSAPDTMIEHVAPAGSCAASAPVTEHSPTATCAAPDTVIEYVAPAGTCAAPASACARCRVHRASTSSVLCCTSPSCPMSHQRPSSSTACQHQRLPTFHHRACAYQCLWNAGHTDRIRGFGWHMRSTSSSV